MKDEMTLSQKIGDVLNQYFKTQFLLITINILLVWGIILVLPEINIVYKILIAILSFVIISQISDLVISPLIFKKRLKINPLLVIVSLIVGASLLGILGVIFAVPAVLIIQTTLNHLFSSSKKD